MSQTQRVINRALLAIAVLAAGTVPVEAQTAADLFNPNVVQEIRLDLHPSDWQSLKDNVLSDRYYACDFRWNGVLMDQVHIRARGRGTRNATKPGLRIDFDREIKDRNFLGLVAMVLDNNAQDATMVRERITMRFVEKMGLPAPREAHARLFVNNQYVGLYGIIEPMNQGFLRRVFNEDDGYFYEYDPSTAYNFEYRGPNPANYSPVPFKPETHEDKPDPRGLEAFIRTLDPENTPDSAFPSAIAPYLDMKKFMRFIAAEMFMAEWDGILSDHGMNNFYLYQFDKQSLIQFIHWDKDNTFGGILRDPKLRIEYPLFPPAADQNVLMRRALRVQEFRDLYVESLLLAAAIAGGRGGWLETEITRQNQLVRQAVVEDNFKQCPGQTACSTLEFDQEIAFMLEFARQRSSFVSGSLSTAVRPFTVTERGGMSLNSAGTSSTVTVTHARIEPSAGNANPAGLAVFGFRKDNVLVSEASVPAVTAIRSGRLFVDIRGAANTGIAIANPGPTPVDVSFYFSDDTRSSFGAGSISIPPNGQVARFLNEAPFNAGNALTGTMSFAATTPVAVLALRGLTNERNEFLLTTLPVVDLAASTPSTLVLPHFADGGGWSSQIVLVNPTDSAVTGTIDFFNSGDASGAVPAMLTIGGQTASSFTFTVPPRASRRLQTSGAGAAVVSGSGRVRVDAPGRLAGLGIFSFRAANVTVTETGVFLSSPETAVRMYVEASGDFDARASGSIETGVALANPTSSSITVNVELTTLGGTVQGMAGSIVVGPNAQVVRFLRQIPGFENLQRPFQGVLRITTSSAAGVAVVGLRGRYNERRDFLIAGTPPVVEARGTPGATQIFPHLIDAGGYTTQLILFSASGPAEGQIRFLSPFGASQFMTFR